MFGEICKVAKKIQEAIIYFDFDKKRNLIEHHRQGGKYTQNVRKPSGSIDIGQFDFQFDLH